MFYLHKSNYTLPSASHQASEGQGDMGMPMRAPRPPSGLAQKMYR